MDTVFQRERALELVDGHVTILVELADSFLKNYDKLVLPIDEGIRCRDANAVEHAAHTLKGSLHYFGNTLLVKEVAALEKMACAGNLPAIETIYRVIHGKLEQLRTELKSLVEEHSLGDSS